MSEALTNIRHITLRHCITLDARQMEVLTQPSLLDSMFKATLFDRVLRQLAHVHSTELVDLRSH